MVKGNSRFCSGPAVIRQSSHVNSTETALLTNNAAGFAPLTLIVNAEILPAVKRSVLRGRVNQLTISHYSSLAFDTQPRYSRTQYKTANRSLPSPSDAVVGGNVSFDVRNVASKSNTELNSVLLRPARGIPSCIMASYVPRRSGVLDIRIVERTT